MVGMETVQVPIVTSSIDLSVVIPLRDELPNIALLYDEWTTLLSKTGFVYELILVDDGSTDGTFNAVTRAQESDPRVRAVRFTQNFGQTAAFSAGFDLARGRLIVTADGDLQNDPVDLSQMLDLAKDFDVVCGWRRYRQEGLNRRLPSVIANWLLGLVSGVWLHDNGCSLKVFRSEVVKPLVLRPGMHRYLPALASRLGDRITEIVVQHRPRRFGRSKYGLSRTFIVLRDLLQLRSLMKKAVESSQNRSPIYEIAELIEDETYP
jgi:glycosyltransferase involved in cell wall biosynthesis